MSFIKIEKQNHADFINIRKHVVTISKNLYNCYFGVGSRVEIFIDEKNKLVGLKPSSDGYSIYTHGYIQEFRCLQLVNVVAGRFIPKWSDKHHMLIISY